MSVASLAPMLPAGAALAAGIFVCISSGTYVVATDGTKQLYVTRAACASGDMPELAQIGENVLVTTDGSVTADSFLTAGAAGVAVSAVPTTAAGPRYTAGKTFTADTGTVVRFIYDPQYHAAAGA